MRHPVYKGVHTWLILVDKLDYLKEASEDFNKSLCLGSLSTNFKKALKAKLESAYFIKVPYIVERGTPSRTWDKQKRKEG
jgi:hypothetical protein